MPEKQIYKKGLLPAPDYLEIDILLYASQKIEIEDEAVIEDYLNWLPLLGSLFLLRDFLKGYRFKLRPILKI